MHLIGWYFVLEKTFLESPKTATTYHRVAEIAGEI
jgi:hypothetical protein